MVWKVIFLVYLMSLSLFGLEKITLGDENRSITDFRLNLYVDESRQHTIETIQTIEFSRTHSNNPSLGYLNDNVWLAFELTNPTQTEKTYFLRSNKSDFTQIDFYIVSENGEYTKHAKGYQAPHKSDIHHAVQLPILLAPAQSCTVYIKAHNEIYPYIFDLLLLHENQIVDYTQQFDRFYTIYFTGAIILLMLNFFVFVFIRQKAYLYYTLYIGSFILWQMQVNGVFPFDTYYNETLYQLSLLPLYLFVIFLLLVSREVLDLKRFAPNSDLVIRGIWLIMMFNLAASVPFPQESMMILNINTSLLGPLFLIIAIRRYFEGSQVAKIYILALSAFLIPALIFSVMTKGYLSYSIWIERSMQIGSLVEMFLFSVALIYRVKLLNDEKTTMVEEANFNLEKHVKLRTKELEEAQEKLKFLADHDPMTQLYNRRIFDEFSRQMIAVAQREQQPLSLILFDLDKFKYINDTYGHHTGDEVIKAFADILKKKRQSDVVARVGGEEFAMLLPNTTKDTAWEIGEQIRQKVEATKLTTPSGKEISYTVSGGVESLDLHSDREISQTYHRADTALYRAKKSGRNRIFRARVKVSS